MISLRHDDFYDVDLDFDGADLADVVDVVDVVDAALEPARPKRPLELDWITEEQTFHHSLLTKEQECELAARIAQGGEDGRLARELLVKHNQRLVMSIARQYTASGMTFMDLHQEGNLGLLKAIEKFDYRRGFRFSTYATWWIRQSVMRAISMQSRMIRLPVYQHEIAWRVRRQAAALQLTLERDPTAQEIADALGLPLEAVVELLLADTTPCSLDNRIDEDKDTLGERLVDPGESVEADAEQEMIAAEMQQILRQTLKPRELLIIQMRHGLGQDGRELTLEAVGKQLGVTRERVRQIEEKALDKLRKVPRMQTLLGTLLG